MLKPKLFTVGSLGTWAWTLTQFSTLFTRSCETATGTSDKQSGSAGHLDDAHVSCLNSKLYNCLVSLLVCILVAKLLTLDVTYASAACHTHTKKR